MAVSEMLFVLCSFGGPVYMCVGSQLLKGKLLRAARSAYSLSELPNSANFPHIFSESSSRE